MSEQHHTTDLEPDTFHARRRLTDGKLLSSVPYELREAIKRAICPYCRLGLPASTIAGPQEVRHEHSTSQLRTVCAAGPYIEEFYSLVRFWESTQNPEEPV